MSGLCATIRRSSGNVTHMSSAQINHQHALMRPDVLGAVMLRPALGFSCSSAARLGGDAERPCQLLNRVPRPGVPGCAERGSGRREGACPTQPAHTTSSRGWSCRRPLAGWRRAEWRDPRCVRPSIMYQGRGVWSGAVISKLTTKVHANYTQRRHKRDSAPRRVARMALIGAAVCSWRALLLLNLILYRRS